MQNNFRLSIRDLKINKWAEVLTSYSLAVKKNQTGFLLGDLEALPLIEATYEQLIRSGAKVEIVLLNRSLNEFLLKYGSEEQISFTPLSRLAAVGIYDFYLYIGANSNSKLLSGINSKKQGLAAGNRSITDTIL